MRKHRREITIHICILLLFWGVLGALAWEWHRTQASSSDKLTDEQVQILHATMQSMERTLAQMQIDLHGLCLSVASMKQLAPEICDA